MVFEVRFHGRGGQGAVTAADLLALATFRDGHWAQSFPSFGSERTGAPVMAFCRISERIIRTREPVVEPDCVAVLDPTLIHQVDLLSGLGADGYLLVNSSRSIRSLGLEPVRRCLRPERILNVPATEVALRRVGRPFPNAALLGAFAALTGQIVPEAVYGAITEHFEHNQSLAQGNVAAAKDLFEIACATMVTQRKAILGAATN